VPAAFMNLAMIPTHWFVARVAAGNGDGRVQPVSLATFAQGFCTGIARSCSDTALRMTS
jgi:hypothetical protein